MLFTWERQPLDIYIRTNCGAVAYSYQHTNAVHLHSRKWCSHTKGVMGIAVRNRTTEITIRGSQIVKPWGDLDYRCRLLIVGLLWWKGEMVKQYLRNNVRLDTLWAHSEHTEQGQTRLIMDRLYALKPFCSHAAPDWTRECLEHEFPWVCV